MSKVNPLVRFIKDLIHNGMESFGRYYSCYRGYVVDNNDPNNLQKLKLVIPQISGDKVFQTWAYPKNVFSGNKADGTRYGSQMLPQKGDIVWVEFEMGHPRSPIWSMGHPGNNDKNQNTEYQDPNTYWFISPQGNQVIINDTKSYIKVILNDTVNGTSQMMELNTTAASIVHSKGISLGKENESSHPAILGDTHNTQMKALYDLIQNHTHTGVQTGAGVSGTVDPATVLQITEQKGNLDNMLSQINTLE